jgi:hypothetical protein
MGRCDDDRVEHANTARSRGVGCGGAAAGRGWGVAINMALVVGTRAEAALEELLFDGFEPREKGKGPPREKLFPMEDGSAAEW